jgi:hypothetical protein
VRFSGRERHLSHRFDICYVELLELSDVVQDFVQLASIHFSFIGRQLEVSEFCHAQNVFAADGHLVGGLSD